MEAPGRPNRRLPRWLVRAGMLLLASTLAHLAGILIVVPLWPYFFPSSGEAWPEPVTVALLPSDLDTDMSASDRADLVRDEDLPDADPLPPEPTPPEPDKPRPLLDARGQIVDLPRPMVDEIPDHADYLAEHNHKAEEESKSDRFKVNPEVLTPTYSSESRLQFRDMVDQGNGEFTSGAQAPTQLGTPRFNPEKDGALGSLPAPFSIASRQGVPFPYTTTHRDAYIAGAPNNDWLDEKSGTAVNLNAREFKYAGYLNRIRRLVNFYWNQNLQNIDAIRTAKRELRTQVLATLTSQGVLETVEVKQSCGLDTLDTAVVDAFKMAGPYPHPPEQLVSPDGLVYLPQMDFIVTISYAQARYQGIDPRAGVQFPGILKAPR